MNQGWIEDLIRTVPDFPEPGILFRDITPLLLKPKALHQVAENLVEALPADIKIDLVAGVESRGFLFAPQIADILGVGVLAIRKSNKLPAETLKVEYELEYGTAGIEVHKDQLPPGAEIFVVDDVLATGGTALAVAELISIGQAHLAGFGFLIELSDLGGRARLQDFSSNITSLVNFAGA